MDLQLDKLLKLPSPLESLSLGLKGDRAITIDIKRDDLIHPLISGNKWRKLKYNIHDFIDGNYKTIITFGGAFSNHLVAVATIGDNLDIPTVGLLRGYKIDEANPTIRILRSMKMELHLVNPKEYKLKEQSEVVSHLLDQYKQAYLIPEGGTNDLAIKGVRELWGELDVEHYTHVVIGLGTAGTLAGVVKGVPYDVEVIAISPFKDEVTELEGFEFIKDKRNYKVIPAVLKTNFGAYDNGIVTYINQFYYRTKILLDPIYTAKVMMTLESMIADDYFPKGSKILFIHTGGLQGILGYNYLHQNKMQSAIAIPPELEILRNYA